MLACRRPQGQDWGRSSILSIEFLGLKQPGVHPHGVMTPRHCISVDYMRIVLFEISTFSHYMDFPDVTNVRSAGEIVLPNFRRIPISPDTRR